MKRLLLVLIFVGFIVLVVNANNQPPTKLFTVTVTDTAISFNFPNATSAQKVIDAIAKQGSFAPDPKQNPSQQESAKRQFVADELKVSIANIILQQRYTEAANDAISKVPKDDIPEKVKP